MSTSAARMSGPLYDVVLRNGTVVDGTGKLRFRADVALKGDRIAAVGALAEAGARTDLDISGCIVAPGFIDVHTHDDAALIARPTMLPKLTQGVTTVIGGNCGISGAPYSTADDPPDLLRLVFKSSDFVAATFADYLQKVEAARPAINCAFLTGHTTLRMEVLGDDLGRAATDSEVARMRELLTECLQQGSIGLSTGLFYPPARAASTQEVIEVAKLLGSFGAIYTTHMRDESDGVVDSLEETLLIGRSIGAPVIVSHHKCMGRQNFGRSAETLSLLKNARQHQPVAWDVYPYTACSTVLNEEMAGQASRTMITWCDPRPDFCARDLDEVAQELGCSPLEAVSRLQPAGALYFMMDEADVTRILVSDGAMIGSDGLPEDQHPHPRLWGTFPRVLGRYVRERKVLTIEDAVHRMTGLPAQQFRLRDRGLVAVGQYADLCVFDPEKVLDTATFEQPMQAAVGIEYVIVNGQMALARGKPTQAREGRILRRETP